MENGPMIDERPEKLSAHEVAVWLRRHPNFLGQFPDLAMSLVVPKDDGKTATLSSYQLEILRDKNKELNRRLHELSINAQDNEKLTHNIHELCLALLRARRPADVVHSLVACLKEDFASESVRVVSFIAIDDVEEDWFRHLESDHPSLQPFTDCLRTNEPICGRLNPEKLPVLFGDDPTFTQSIALIPISGTGLVAIGSQDPHRFYPGMGTLFLRWIGDLYQTALTQARR
jgi:uncharacterized protein YigA (DUF484 family)